RTFTWIRNQAAGPGSAAGPEASATSFTGTYHKDIDLYETLSITKEQDTLKAGKVILLPLAANKFAPQGSPGDKYEFIKDRQGRIQKLVMTIEAPKVYQKIQEA